MTRRSRRFGGYTREQLRQSYAEAWRKHLARSPLTPLESHDRRRDRRAPGVSSPSSSDADGRSAFEPAAAERRRESVFTYGAASCGSRAGVRSTGRRESASCSAHLQARLGDAHGAEHALMEALAETLWEAQRDGQSAR